MKIVDWIARTTMLVLAALATLALIGSLASVSNSPIGAAFPGTVAPPPPETVPVEASTSQPADAPTTTAPDTPETDAARVVAQADRAAASRASEVARWLKALTYAVIALAAFAAAGVVALLRIGGHLARIAGR